jgi:hypothetical protein
MDETKNVTTEVVVATPELPAELKEIKSPKQIGAMKPEQLDAFIETNVEKFKSNRLKAIANVVNVGYALMEQKRRLPKGEFRPWAEKYHGIAPSTVTYLMDMAKRWDKLLAEQTGIELKDLSVRSLKLLTEPEKAKPAEPEPKSVNGTADEGDDEGESDGGGKKSPGGGGGGARPQSGGKKTDAEPTKQLSESEELLRMFSQIKWIGQNRPEYRNMIVEETRKLLSAMAVMGEKRTGEIKERDAGLIKAIEEANAKGHVTTGTEEKKAS